MLMQTADLLLGDVEWVLEHCPLHDLAAGGSGEGAFVSIVPVDLVGILQRDDGTHVKHVK